MRSHFSPAPVWGDLLERGVRMAKASNMELRKSVLEGEIHIHTVLKEEIRSPKH